VASIFYDYGLTLPAPNPTQTDANGNFTVYAAALTSPNLYVVNAVPQLGTTYTWVVPGPASQGYISIPVPISQGGTFATTAAGAWTNIFSGAGITSNCTLLQNVSGTLTCTATTAAGALANLGGAALTGATFTGPVQDGTTVLPNQVNPAAFGTVDSTGVASSTAAFQAAINTGKCVSVPPGEYNVCGLQPNVYNTFADLCLVGPGNNRSRRIFDGAQFGNGGTGPWTSFPTNLHCASGDMFTIPLTPGTPPTPPANTHISVSGMGLIASDATASGNVFNLGASAYITDFILRDVGFATYNPAKSWIVGSGGMQEMVMSHVIGIIANGNTVPAVQLDGQINEVDIGNTNFSYNGVGSSYSQHYFVELNQNSGGASNVHIHDSLCEVAEAGCFNLNAVGNASIDDVDNYDLAASPTAPFITIGPASSQVELKSIISNNLSNGWSTPDLSCPVGVCEFHNSFLTDVSFGGTTLDHRGSGFYLDYTPAERIDSLLTTVSTSADGFSGSGMIGNLITRSDSLNDFYSVNNGTGVAPVISGTGQADPLGGTSAIQATFSVPSTGASVLRFLAQPGAGTYTIGVWAKACSGTANFVMYNTAGWNQPNHTVGTTWTRIYDTASSFSSSPYEQPSIGLDTSTGSSYTGTVCLDLYGATLTPGSAIMAYVSTSASGAPAPIQPRTVVNGLPVATLPINAATQITGIVPAANLVAANMPALPAFSGTGALLAGPSEAYTCTGTCTPTLPVPPAAGQAYQFCVANDMGVTTAITFQAIGSGVMYPKGDGTGWGTAGTGTFTMTAAAGNKVCFQSKDATHYNLMTINGTGTAN
jgi:hypothetical protein